MTRGVKTKLTDEQWKRMGEYALDGCQDGTIAALMDIPKQTISKNKEIGTFLLKKRGERKRAIRRAQFEKATKTKDTAMLCFLGKNELNQSDRQDHKLKVEFEEISVKIG